MNDTTAPEAVIASQVRRAFQKQIGADPEENHELWSDLDYVINTATDQRDAEHHAEVARLAAHFPSLEKAMLIVWSHITRGVAIAPCGACERG